ncbi:teichuronic acid biosynthesis glycosyltransferase TuaG [Priestia megaterium]|uniref:glycosyltransferase family 2 protein n=1 Tax=Priestia megaterium TaxID=1404 RepID=UPI0015DCFA5D|nr:glycosyltransferase [Priestia megaterium]MBD8114353.1 glycosyltransferase [Priestia megaterium]QLK09006.1 Beta-1,3-glucosyltransferase [Priestia megaterium]
MSKVSIIVPFYNCPYINQALDSLINQTYKDIEIIVVNDGSTQYVEKIIPYLDRIKYIQKENGGTASALNRGIEHATGDYFCWLSSDDIYYPEKTEVQFSFMKEKNALFSHTNYCAIDKKSRIISPPLGIQPPSRLEIIKRISTKNFINGCSVMIDKSVFNHVGVFDETLPYTHDYDLWIRIIHKFDVFYLSQPLLLYRIHKQMGSKKHAVAIKKEIDFIINHHKNTMESLLSEELRK